MKNDGVFITFEGIDGCGKTTVSKEIYKRLKAERHDVIYTVEPTNTWLGSVVKKCYTQKLSPLTDTFLFTADRVEHAKKIEEWLKEGRTVISDRYMDSTCAYQSVSLRGVVPRPLDFLLRLHQPFAPTPDLTFVLIIPPEKALARIAKRNKKEKTHTTKFETLAFLTDVQKAYEALMKRAKTSQSSEDTSRFVCVDADRNADAIAEDVRKIIKTRAGL